jgi:diguanylate cyclase (GGDEF)-like protein
LALVLPGADKTAALRIAEEFCARLRDLVIPHSGSDKNIVTASVGLASMRPGASHLNADRLIARADEALYAAKRDGRDGVRAWELGKLHIVQSNSGPR